MYKLNHKCFGTVIQTLLFEQSVKEDKILVCRKDNLIHIYLEKDSLVKNKQTQNIKLYEMIQNM